MLTLYESCGWPFCKVLYDVEKNRVLGQYQESKLGWIWPDDLKVIESEYSKEQVEKILSCMQRNKIGKTYTTKDYDTWEDFVIDQL